MRKNYKSDFIKRSLLYLTVLPWLFLADSCSKSNSEVTPKPPATKTLENYLDAGHWQTSKFFLETTSGDHVGSTDGTGEFRVGSKYVSLNSLTFTAGTTAGGGTVAIDGIDSPAKYTLSKTTLTIYINGFSVAFVTNISVDDKTLYFLGDGGFGVYMDNGIVYSYSSIAQTMTH